MINNNKINPLVFLQRIFIYWIKIGSIIRNLDVAIYSIFSLLLISEHNLLLFWVKLSCLGCISNRRCIVSQICLMTFLCIIWEHHKVFLLALVLLCWLALFQISCRSKIYSQFLKGIVLTLLHAVPFSVLWLAKP